jgi:hypothetical protein
MPLKAPLLAWLPPTIVNLRWDPFERTPPAPGLSVHALEPGFDRTKTGLWILFDAFSTADKFTQSA